MEKLPAPSTPQATIAEVLGRDILGAEFLLALLWSAMNSFRHDSILRPFPPMFLEAQEGSGGAGEGPEEGRKDIEGLRQVFESLPPLDSIAEGRVALSTQQTELLQWILNPKRFSVSYKQPSTFASLLSQLDSTLTPDKLPRKPNYIFELEYNEECESKFRTITGEHGIMYAVHGSSVENFYSIVHNGLLNIFNKVSAFGEGTYLSTELGVCLNWSPSGSFHRGGGPLPQVATCVAMCEVVKHPSVMSRQQVGGEPNIQGRVPEKYFIVSNDEFIRIKYLFVFEAQKPVVRSRGWLYQHKYAVVLLIYLLFLFAVGASQSKYVRRFFRKYYNYYLS